MLLSSEDALRLNVLLAGELLAVRIDESTMTVYGLSAAGEAKVRLNPTLRDDQYLRRVREMISERILGFPGGYPAFLTRWTRMGQTRDNRLGELLKLGEPEAVSAVVHAPGITAELARRAWWADSRPENARSMLRRQEVIENDIGKLLAAYLIEHLPFEEAPATAAETVRLILQPGLVDDAARRKMWGREARGNSCRVGFLLATPDDLPDPPPPRRRPPDLESSLRLLSDAGNPFAAQLLRVSSGAGQRFLRAAADALREAEDQDVFLLIFEAIAGYFHRVRLDGEREADLGGLLGEIEAFAGGTEDSNSELSHALQALLKHSPELEPEARAMLFLSRLAYPLARSVLSNSTAVGALMRKKLEPVITPITRQLALLQGNTPAEDAGRNESQRRQRRSRKKPTALSD